MKAIKDREARVYMQRFTDAYHSELCDIFCGPFREGSIACTQEWKGTYPSWGQKQPRNQSLHAPVYMVAFHDLGIKGHIQDLFGFLGIPLPPGFDELFDALGIFTQIPGASFIGELLAPAL